MIQIGDQIWSENDFDITKYINGEPLYPANTPAEWEFAFNNKIPAYCNYKNLEEKNQGKIYNHHVVEQAKEIVPNGWRIPFESDFDQLFNYIIKSNNIQNIGFKLPPVATHLKSISGWSRQNGINSVDFNAQPCVIISKIICYSNYDLIDNQDSLVYWMNHNNEYPLVLFLSNYEFPEKRIIPASWKYDWGCSIRLIKETNQR